VRTLRLGDPFVPLKVKTTAQGKEIEGKDVASHRSCSLKSSTRRSRTSCLSRPGYLKPNLGVGKNKIDPIGKKWVLVLDTFSPRREDWGKTSEVSRDCLLNTGYLGKLRSQRGKTARVPKKGRRKEKKTPSIASLVFEHPTPVKGGERSRSDRRKRRPQIIHQSHQREH